MAEEAANALVDTHTHLNDEKFAGDVEETIARARAAGVTRLRVCTRIDARAHTAAAPPTTSMPTTGSSRQIRRTESSSSRAVRPPGSGVPVPGA